MKTMGPRVGREGETRFDFDFELSDRERDPSCSKSTTTSDVGGESGEVTVTTVADFLGERTRGVVGEFTTLSGSDSEADERAGVDSENSEAGVQLGICIRRGAEMP